MGSEMCIRDRYYVKPFHLEHIFKEYAMDDHMTLLHDHFLFQGAEELLHEAQSLGVSRFSRGDTICDPATAGRALGIVLEGRAEAVAPTREKAVLAVFGPGGTFGAAALFGGDGYVSRIRAVTACAVVLLFVLLLWRGITIAAHAPDRFGALLVVGFTVQVALQAVLNVAVVTNTIPNTGISLPFFSSGGTSLMMLLGEMGIVLSVSRGET